MKFPRNAKIMRGSFDAAPYMNVAMLLLLFGLLASLMYTPGVRVDLPEVPDLPGIDSPSIAVAVDASGRLYFENQSIGEDRLRAKLKHAVEMADEPLTLVVQADKSVSYERLIHLTQLARESGIKEALLATLPRAFHTQHTAQ